MIWEDVLKLKSEAREIMDEVDKWEKSQKQLLDISNFILDVYVKIKKVRFPTRGIGQPIKIGLFTIAQGIYEIKNIRDKLAEHEFKKLEEIIDWAED